MPVVEGDIEPPFADSPMGPGSRSSNCDPLSVGVALKGASICDRDADELTRHNGEGS